ncbi:NYN domain-containing protein [Candidatus Dojkabacteria bacterium]|nr:NYN domain-containing protein [Candidatus Dojkabacteria bacterium]
MNTTTKTHEKKKKISNFAFIDSQNLNLGIRTAGWKLDFKKFRLYLKNKYKIDQAYLFIGHISGNEKLYTDLQKAGYIIVFKPTLEIKKKENIVIKGNVDAELVLHAMIEYPNYNKAYIASGDGDFHCLIEYLVENNKLGRVLTPNSKYSSLLRKFHKYIARLDLLKDKLKYGKSTPKPRKA